MMVIALLVTATAVNAQGRGPGKGPRPEGGKGEMQNLSPEEHAKKRTEGMIKRFGFPQDLYAKIYPIQLERMVAVKKARATEPADKAAMKTANLNYKAGLKKTLTATQYQQVEQAWAEAKAKRQQNKGDKGPKGAPHDELED